MPLVYGLDIKVKTTQPNDDGWRPIIAEQGTGRRQFRDLDALFKFQDELQRQISTLGIRIVQLADEE